MAAKKKAKGGKAGRDILCVGSKVKAYVKSKKFKCAGDLVEGISNKVYGLLDDAMGRTAGNKRSTVRPTDL
ncbi:MAG: hypothetical protein ACT4PV_09880 [Planctomycetaceae bacterium]